MPVIESKKYNSTIVNIVSRLYHLKQRQLSKGRLK